MRIYGRSKALKRWITSLIITIPLGFPTASHSAHCDISGELRQRFESSEFELPHEFQKQLTRHQIQGHGSENYIQYFTNTADPNSLSVYNIRTNNSAFTAQTLAKHFRSALPAEYSEPILRRILEQSKEMEGALSIKHQMDPDGSHVLKLSIDTLPKAPGSPSAHDSIVTLPTERTVMDGLTIPRFEVAVRKDSITLFTATGSGRQEGKWIVTDLSTSHGSALVVKSPHQANEPMVFSGTLLSSFLFGPKARPGIVSLLEFALKTGSGLYPNRPIILKLVDKSYRFSPALKTWEPI